MGQFRQSYFFSLFLRLKMNSYFFELFEMGETSRKNLKMENTLIISDFFSNFIVSDDKKKLKKS